MREINELICIGNALDARNPKTIVDARIQAVVDLAVDEPSAFRTPREVIYLRIPLMDGGSNSNELLLVAVQSVVTLLRARIRTMVCCSAGLSRSPAVAAAGLAFVDDIRYAEALDVIKQAGPCEVHPAMAESILERFEQLR